MPVVLEAIPAQLDHPATPADPVTPDLPVDPATPDNQPTRHAKPSNLHHASLAQLVLPDQMDNPDNLATLVKMDNPERAVETPNLDPQDPKVHPDLPDNPVDPDNPATPDNPLNPKALPPAHPDLPAMLELPDNPEAPDNLEAMDNPDNLDPKAHPANPVDLANPETMDNPATLANPEAKANEVSARNTAPSTVVFSSKMERGVKPEAVFSTQAIKHLQTSQRTAIISSYYFLSFVFYSLRYTSSSQDVY